MKTRMQFGVSAQNARCRLISMTILALLLLRAAAVRGDIVGTDPSFSGGKVQTDFTIQADKPSDDVGSAAALQSDGKIVLVGTTSVDEPGYPDFQIVRYMSDGSLDKTFGGGGHVHTDFFGKQDDAHAVALASNGRIVVGGTSGTQTGQDFSLARYNEDGSLDPGFGIGGKVTTDFTPTTSSIDYGDQIFALAIQRDGKIVAAGQSRGFAFNLVAARYERDGSLDTTFGSGGKVLTDVAVPFPPAGSVSIQADGKILICCNGDFTTVRLSPSGALDGGFGNGGRVRTDFDGRASMAMSLSLQSDGKILVAGTSHSFDRIRADQVAVARYQQDGSPDPAFGVGGRVRLSDLDRNMTVRSLQVQTDGRFVVAGQSRMFNFSGDFALTRFNADGSIDSSFGDKGIATTDFSGRDDEAESVLIQADGKIIAAGSAGSVATRNDFAVARYTPSGRFDPQFGTGGRVAVTSNPTGRVSNAVVIQLDGKIVVAGTSFNLNDQGRGDDFSVIRLNPDGSMDQRFGFGGVVTTDFGMSNDIAYAVALQQDGKLVVAGVSAAQSKSKFAVARYNSDGSLDPGFGSGGLVNLDLAPLGSGAKSVAVQQDGKIVLGGNVLVARPALQVSIADFAVVRLNSDGTLDAGFGNNGVVTTDFAGDSDVLESIAVQQDGKIVAGGYAVIARDFIGNPIYELALARYNVDGQLDSGFGSGGKVGTDFFGSYDKAHSIAIQSDGKILAAGEAFNPSNTGSAIMFALARYNQDGSLDGGFGSNGRVTTDFNQGVASATSMDIQRDGKIVLGGFTNGLQSYDFALARYNTNGNLDTSFGTNGLAQIDFFQDSDYAYGVASQADGKIVIVGSANAHNGFGDISAIARYDSNRASADCEFPIVSGAAISGKNLIVNGRGFQSGATLLLDGEAQTTLPGATDPSRMLIGKKAGKKLKPGANVTIQVRNACGRTSAAFNFVRP